MGFATAGSCYGKMKFRPLNIILPLAVAAAMLAMAGCGFMKVNYSFTGAQIADGINTVSIAYFPNNAPMVAPTLSSELTDGLQDKFSRQTKLKIVTDGPGDMSFEGEIIGYAVMPVAVSSTDEMASQNRLTITVRVTFVNIVEPHWSFANKTFSAYKDYSTTFQLSEVENQLITDIVEILVDDIFNAAVSNW